MTQNQSLPVIVLFGPTSSGKTALSIELAQRANEKYDLQTVVISADSRQVYKYMDIGTSKTTYKEMQGVPHEMLDVTEPVRKFELEQYVELARERIAAAQDDGRLVLIVGGTGIYVKSLLDGWQLGGTGSMRQTLLRDFPRQMSADAFDVLERLDRKAAARIHPNNYEAIINALSIAMIVEPVVAGQSSVENAQSGQAAFRHLILGLEPPQRVLNAKVAATYDRQVANGLYDEIEALTSKYNLDQEMRKRGNKSQNQVLHTHGYREFFELSNQLRKPVAHLRATELDEVRAAVLNHIQAYTRRQRTWFPKLGKVKKIKSASEALALIDPFI